MQNLNPNTTLHKIVAAKKVALDKQKARTSYAQMEQALGILKPFKGPGLFEALKAGSPKPKLIAEVKQASPSKGVIRKNFSVADINKAYQSIDNVVVISVLTEADYFRGDNEILSFVASNNTNNKPLLRKDFIFDTYQVLETKVLGAQAYLLIASLFEDDEEMEKLIKAGQELDLEPLVEVHTKEELAMVRATSARVIGVNCRDMKTFAIDHKVHELLKEIENTYAKVAESGIESHEYLHYVTGFCDAALVGSYLMAQDNIVRAIKGLVGS